MPIRVSSRAALTPGLTLLFLLTGATAAAPLAGPAGRGGSEIHYAAGAGQAAAAERGTRFQASETRRGERSRVQAEAGASRAFDLADLARRADAAAVRVTAVLGTPLRPLVLVPATDAAAARLIGAPPSAVAGLAALAEGKRVIVVPSGYARLNETGRDVVLTHELTHVAAGAARVPAWLREGFADYLAYRDSGLAVRDAAAELLAELRAGHVPSALPTDFTPGSPRLAQSYQEAWLACRLIALEYGEKRLVRFYRAAEHGHADLSPFGDFTTRWRAHLRQLGESE